MSVKDADLDKSQVYNMDDKGYEFLAEFVVVADGSIGLRWDKRGLDLLADNNVSIEQMEQTMNGLIERSLTEGTEASH